MGVGHYYSRLCSEQTFQFHELFYEAKKRSEKIGDGSLFHFIFSSPVCEILYIQKLMALKPMMVTTMTGNSRFTK